VRHIDILYQPIINLYYDYRLSPVYSYLENDI